MKANTYEVTTTLESARNAFANLRKTQRPGENSGRAKKTDVLNVLRPEVHALMAEGYTARQIADALKNDVFNILPKTITQMFGKKAASKKKPAVKLPAAEKPTQRQTAAVVTKQARPQQKEQPKAGAFSIKPDSEDL